MGVEGRSAERNIKGVVGVPVKPGELVAECSQHPHFDKRLPRCLRSHNDWRDNLDKKQRLPKCAFPPAGAGKVSQNWRAGHGRPRCFARAAS